MLHSIRKLIWLLVVLILALLAALLVVANQQSMVNSDFFTFWLGAHLVGDGQNVYDPAIWAEGHTRYGSTWLENRYYVYPLPLAILQVPLGWLTLQSSATLWVFGSICSLVAVVLLLRTKGYPIVNTLFLVTGVFLQRSVITTLRNGQMGAVLLLLLVLCTFLMHQRKDAAAGICLSILILKPTVGFPLAGLLILYAFLKREYRLVIFFVSSLLLMVASSLVISPGWISSFLALGASKGNTVAGFTPTWWGIAGAICSSSSPCLPILGTSGSILIAAAGIFLLVKYHPVLDVWQAGGLITTISLILTPYLWAYDQILLLFPLIWMVQKIHQSNRPSLALLLPILFAVLGFLLLGVAVSVGNDRASAINTLVVMASLGAVILQEKRHYERVSSQN